MDVLVTNILALFNSATISQLKSPLVICVALFSVRPIVNN